MITQADLHEAIAHCHGEHHPNANTCAKLASYYVILDHLEKGETIIDGGYSYANEPTDTQRVVTYPSSSQFAKLIDGRDIDEVWPIVEELLDAVQVLHPRLYDAFMQKLKP